MYLDLKFDIGMDRSHPECIQTTKIHECVWMWPGYGTNHFLVHFTHAHALSTKHDVMYIPATTPPIKFHHGHCHSPATPLPLFNTQVMPLQS